MTLSLDLSHVVSDLSVHGFCHVRNFLPAKSVNSILQDTARYRYSFNVNKPGGICTSSQYYNTSLLSISKTFYQLIVSDCVHQLCHEYFSGSRYRLRCHRYYETYGNHFMQWHSDMKIPKRGIMPIPGLIFIIYLSEVSNGEFQYIRGSHKYFPEDGNYDYAEHQLLSMFGDDSIVSFTGSPGDLIVYNTAGIHRAKPSLDSNFSRSSLFFQIDTQSNDSEPTFINPSFVDPTNLDILSFLGFGQPSTFPEFPVSTVNSASTSLLISEVLIPYLKFLPKRIYRKILVQFVRIKYLAKSLLSNFSS